MNLQYNERVGRTFFLVQIMDKSIRKKLKSKSGASLMLALFVFLICAMVGATILAAASASSGVVTTTWTDDADVYAMKSAAALFDDTFENATEFNANNAEYVKDNDGTIKVPTSTTLDTLYKTLCVYEYNQNAGSISETITMTVNSKDIQASVTMDDSYNVTAVFTMTGSTRKVTSAINASPTTGNTPRERGNSVSFLPANITVQ